MTANSIMAHFLSEKLHIKEITINLTKYVLEYKGFDLDPFDTLDKINAQEDDVFILKLNQHEDDREYKAEEDEMEKAYEKEVNTEFIKEVAQQRKEKTPSNKTNKEIEAEVKENLNGIMNEDIETYNTKEEEEKFEMAPIIKIPKEQREITPDGTLKKKELIILEQI